MAIVWTTQPRAVLDALQEQGTLYADPTRSGYYEYWVNDYEWMREQMRKRLPNYGGRYPWWGWSKRVPYYVCQKRKVLDDQWANLVCIKLDIPRSELLPSLLVPWEMVSNRCYIACREGEWEEWVSELDRVGIDDRKWPLPEPWGSRLTQSWERIFDCEDLVASGLWSNVVQVTFETLTWDSVIAVEPFYKPKRPRLPKEPTPAAE